MIKTMLWIGASSLATFLAATFSSVMENISFILVLSVIAVILAILPHLIDQATP